MEKFFIHILDAIKHVEVKAEEKSQRKKYWLLGNQYLQPVDDVEEEKMCLDYDFKKKAQCVYQAARRGMKEGVLTGVFLGGFYGLIKNLNENMSNALMPPSLIKVNSPKEGKEENGTDKNLITVNENDTENTVQGGNNNDQPQSDFREETFTRDSTLKNKKRGKSAFTKSDTPDRGSSNEIKMERRPNSAGQSANENLFSVENVRPNTVTNVENSKSKPREKVEIVSYAFVQTLETRDSESSSNSVSDDPDKRKEGNQKVETKSKVGNKSEAKNSENSDQSGRSLGSTYAKNVVESIQDFHRRNKLYKKDKERRKFEETKLSSGSSSSQESYPAQVLLEPKSKPKVEGKTNEKKDLEIQTNENNSESGRQENMESSKQSTTDQSEQKPVLDKDKINLNKGAKKNASKGSRLSIKPKESKDSKSDSKRDKSNKTKNRFSKSEKGTAFSKQKKSEGLKSKPFNAFYENFFIPNKISKSILVDADRISNGYSLSLNNESLNSREEFDPLSESNFNVLDASGQRMNQFIDHSKIGTNDSDTVLYTQRKKLAFVEPEISSLSEEPSMGFESLTPSPTQIKEDSSNNESRDSTGSDSESGQVSHAKRAEDLNEPLSAQSIKSVGDNQPGSGQSVKPSSNSEVVKSIRSTVLSGHTSPKTMSIGDSAATSFVQNDGFSNRQSKVSCDDKTSDTKIVGSEFTTNKDKDREFPCAPKSGYLLLKNVSDNLMLLSACNCAVVLGVLCAVISTTKASLSF